MKRIAVFFVCAAALIVATFAIVRKVQNNVNAASTADGEAVGVTMGEEIQYGSSGSDTWQTHKYYITNSSGTIFEAMCAEPIKAGPGGGQWFSNIIDVNEMKYKQIKLIMYIFFNQNDTSVGVDGSGVSLNKVYLDGILSDQDNNLRFAYVHSLIGYFYSGDTSGLAPSQVQWASIVGDQLAAMINDNDIRWRVAQGYDLHMTTGDNTFQRIAWLEKSPIQYGKIIVNKIDSDTESCTTTTSNLSLNGAKFALINSSNETIATKTITNGCSVEFDNIPYGSYTVSEVEAPAGYTAVSTSKNVTLSGASASVTFSNTPTKYKITVNKIDSETGSCTNTAALSFAGIKFTLVNNTGGTIKYGGSLIANGGDVAVKTLSGNSCSVEFTGLPNGKYTIKESSVTAGYSGDSNKSVTISNGNQSVTFSNAPLKGKIIVNKTDSDTGTCTSVGSLSLAGTKFSLINSTGGPVKYGSQTYNNGATIATKTIAANACSVEFDGLPYGAYTVKEDSASTGYTVNTNSKSVTLSGASASVSFSNTPVKGKITVSKVDSGTGTCTTQGNASLNGTKFQLTNNSDNPIYYGGNTIAKGAVVDTKTLTNGACSVEFNNLPYGSYIVKEVAVGSGYQIDNTAKTVTIPTNNNVNVTVSYSNDPILGSVTVNKVDETTNSCTTTSNFSFNGTVFSITNNSTNPIYYGNSSYAKGAVITSKTISGDACNVKFDNLPYGEYIIKETHAGTGYALNTNSFNVTIPTNNSVNVSTTIADPPIRGDLKFVKYDENNDTVMENVLFSISSIDENNQIKETHIVVTNADGVVDTSASFAAHTNHTNGYDILYDDVDEIAFAGYGTWFGLDKNGNPISANDTMGALPYGTYVIQELKCGSNFFCTGVLNQKATVTINSNNQVVDLGNWNNNCTKFMIDTVATDNIDGDKYIEVNGEATLKDTIEYSITPNKDFVIRGIVMDKSTGEPLLVNGETVEGEIKVRSEGGEGTAEMLFTFDASELGGKRLVVFESLYYVNGFDSHLITEHNDINDDDQSIDVISFTTLATNKATGEKTLPIDSEAEIKDIVSYCLKPGVEYTVKGVLMDGQTKNAALSNNKTVENEVTFTPTEACGSFEVFYKVNTKDLGGRKLIIFDTLYEGDEIILEHKDFNNENETAVVDLPVPDTGFSTNFGAGVRPEVLSVFGLAAGAFVVVWVKRSRKSSHKISFDKK